MTRKNTWAVSVGSLVRINQTQNWCCFVSNSTNPINKMFAPLIYWKNSTFLSLKIIVDTDWRQEVSLTVAWFFWINHNFLLRIATNASFCIDNRLRQMAFFVFTSRLSSKDERPWNKKSCSCLFLYYIKQIDSMLPCICSVISPRVPLFCSYHILTSSVIYYWTYAGQHGIYLLSIYYTIYNIIYYYHIYYHLYNKPSFSRNLIGSHLWSIRGQTRDWRHHHKVFPSAFSNGGKFWEMR